MVHAVPGLWSADFLERSMSDCRPPRAGLCASLEHPEHCSRSEFSLLRSPHRGDICSIGPPLRLMRCTDRQRACRGGRFDAPLADDWKLRLEGAYLDFGRTTYSVNHSGNNSCGPGNPRRRCPYNVENALVIVRLAIIHRFGE